MQESSFPLSMGSKTCGAGWKNFPSLPPPTPLPHIFLISLTRVGSNLFLPSFCLCFPRYTSHVLPPFVSCDCLKLQLFDFSPLFDFPPVTLLSCQVYNSHVSTCFNVMWFSTRGRVCVASFIKFKASKFDKNL